MESWAIHSLVPELLAGLILLAVIPISIAIFGWFKSIKLPYVLTIAMVCFASGLYIFEKVDWKKPALTPEKIKDHLQDLALEAKFGITPDHQEGTRFQFALTKNKTKETAEEAINIINKKELNQSYIFLAIGITTANDINFQKLLEKMNEREKLEFTSNIKIQLLSHGISYAGLKYPFQKIMLLDMFVYNESLTLVEFIEKLKPIRNAKTLINVFMNTKNKELQLAQEEQEAQETTSSSDSLPPEQ